MKTITKYRQCGIVGESSTSDSIQEMAPDRTDLLIGASSWDARCLCLVQKAGLQAAYGIMLRFKRKDSLGLRDHHDPILKSFIEKVSNKVIVIEEESTEADSMWGILKKAVLDVFEQRSFTPMRVLLDASTCPKYYLCALLSLLIKCRMASEISIIYSEATYPIPPKDAEIQFTGALWKTVCIDSLEGKFYASKDKAFVVSVGFEGDKTMRSVCKADPDTVSILLPDPGFESNYVGRALTNNLKLVEKFCIDDRYLIRAHAGDAIDTWRQLNSQFKAASNQNNIYYLCSGSKPHAIGMALSAITLETPCVLYNIPDEHKVVPIITNGTYWKYFLKDVTIVS